MREYDLIADWYALNRIPATAAPSAVPEALSFAASLTRGARILDIGCGNGIPVTRILLDAGHHAIGLDSSSRMLELFRINLPSARAVHGLVEDCPFADETFDAAFSWGVWFHLTQERQARAIASVSRILRRGARFLFSSGDVDGPDGLEDIMNGVVFRYYSFTVDGYRALLREHGLTLLDVHADKGKNTYYLAEKS